jgi:hypothetical protein
MQGVKPLQATGTESGGRAALVRTRRAAPVCVAPPRWRRRRETRRTLRARHRWRRHAHAPVRRPANRELPERPMPSTRSDPPHAGSRGSIHDRRGQRGEARGRGRRSRRQSGARPHKHYRPRPRARPEVAPRPLRARARPLAESAHKRRATEPSATGEGGETCGHSASRPARNGRFNGIAPMPSMTDLGLAPDGTSRQLLSRHTCGREESTHETSDDVYRRQPCRRI